MSLFESLLVLLLVAIALLQISRRLQIPYPAMLAAAGVFVAFLPGTPEISIDPKTALPLFIAPVIVDAAYDFPPGAALRFLAPLLTFAVFAVLATAGVVAFLAHHMIGLPIAAAVALGAIVAPPDAAAATAILSSISVPRNTEELLKGESLFNDATALLLFDGALVAQSQGSLTWVHGLGLAAAAPGGILLGVVWALLFRRLNHHFRDTLGGNLLQFVNTYLVWIVAENFGLSAVLCTVAFAMTIARSEELKGFPRMRVQSFAVWSAVVFTLNVLAFLIMGMQARRIAHHMQSSPLRDALRFAAVIVLTVIAVRLLIVVSFNRLNAWRARRSGTAPPASLRQALFFGWSGMRGFVTLATAFALPENFPQRDVIVLTAFAVVLGTLVLQGLTLRPMIRLLRLDRTDSAALELDTGRSRLARAALRHLDSKAGPVVDHLRLSYTWEEASALQQAETDEATARRELGLGATAAERDELEELRRAGEIGISAYGQLQEEIDWRELTLLRDEERKIQES